MLVLILGDLHLPLRASSLPLKFRKLLVPGKIQQIICTGNVCDRETWEYLRTIAPDVKGVRGDFDESPHLPPTLIVNHSPIRLGVIHGHQILPLGDPDLLNSLATTMDVDVFISGATHKYEAYEADGRFFINPGSATGAWCSIWPVTQGDVGEAGEQHKEASSSAPGEADKDKDDETKDVDAADAAASKSKEAPSDTAAAAAATTPTPTPTPTPPRPHPDPTPSFVLLDIQGSHIMCYTYQLIAGEVKVEKVEYKKDLSGGGGAGGAVQPSEASSLAAQTSAASIAAATGAGGWA